MKREPGRPSKIEDAAVLDRLLRAVRLGVTHRAACAAAGVDPSTVNKWLAQGRRQRRGRYRAFFAALREARHQGELALMARVHQLAKQDADRRTALRANMFVLQTRYAKAYGRHDTHTLKGDATAGAVVVFVPEVHDTEPPEFIRARLAARKPPVTV